MSDFERAFGVPPGHALRTVASGPRRGEHEEYDAEGRLVAVYESRRGGDGGLAYVKYSPQGWVLSVSGRSPRLPPPRARGRAAPAGR